MELFAILFSIPLSFVLSIGYCATAGFLVQRIPFLSQCLRWQSALVVGILVMEFALLISIGPIGARRLVGRSFIWLHYIVFFLAVPSVANLILLRKKSPSLEVIGITTMLCTGLAFLLVLNQYSVTETLYGHDGMIGPFHAEDGGGTLFSW